MSSNTCRTGTKTQDPVSHANALSLLCSAVLVACGVFAGEQSANVERPPNLVGVRLDGAAVRASEARCAVVVVTAGDCGVAYALRRGWTTEVAAKADSERIKPALRWIVFGTEEQRDSLFRRDPTNASMMAVEGGGDRAMREFLKGTTGSPWTIVLDSSSVIRSYIGGNAVPTREALREAGK